MKKYLIVLAAALVALASCKNNGGGNEYTSIKFKNAEIALAVGTSDKLAVLYEPTTLEPPTCVWASSDSNVVTVDQNGNIEAIDLGEANITATCGEGESALQAVCKVSVKEVYDLVEWGACTWWGIDKTPLSTDTVIRTLRSGQQVHCVPIKATFRIWDNNIVYDETNASGSNLYLAGEGFCAFGTGTALLITEALDNNGANYYYLGVDSIKFVDYEEYDPTQAKYAYCAPTGKISGTAEENYYYWYSGDKDAPEAWVGTEIMNLNCDSATYVNGGGLAGFIGKGYFVGDETMCYAYDIDIDWFDCLWQDVNKLSYFGLKLLYDAESQSIDFADPVEWAETFKKHYQYESAAGTAKGYTIRAFDEKKAANSMPKIKKSNNVLMHK